MFRSQEYTNVANVNMYTLHTYQLLYQDSFDKNWVHIITPCWRWPGF